MAPFPPALHRLDVIGAVRAAAARAPDRIAIDAGLRALTYRALGERLAAASDGATGASRPVRIGADEPVEAVCALLETMARGNVAVPGVAAPDDLATTVDDPEDRPLVVVTANDGAPVVLSNRVLHLRALDAAVMHPASGPGARAGSTLPIASPDGIVAVIGALILGATFVPFGTDDVDGLAAALAAGRLDHVWLGPEWLTALARRDAGLALPAPHARLRLAVCTTVPTPQVRDRLLAWLGPERVTAQTGDARIGPVRRHPRLGPADAAVGVATAPDAPPARLRLTIAAGIRANALARPQRDAIVVGERRLDYAHLDDRIARVAGGALADLGLRAGDRVAVMLPNCLEYFEIIAGFAEARVAPALLPPMAIADEVRFIVADCGARVLVCDTSNEEVARAGASGLVERILVVGRDYDDWLARARPARDLPPVLETDVFSIPYTSGATGRPKGILLSHRSRILTAYAAAAEYRALGPDTRMLVSTPVFHGAGFLNLLAPLWFGGTAFVLPRFSIDRLLALVADARITAAHMVPAHFAAYFALSPTERAKHDVSSLRSIVSGTAPLAQATKERIVEAFGADVLNERYGSTEASIVTNLRPEDQLRKIACVGTPFPMVEVQIRDADGRPVPPGTPGELWSRSPIMFSGYWNRPEAEAAAVRDGWVTAGDIARTDDEGYVYLVDRKNDMIITGGENVYPREIEEVLMRHPAVAEVAVVGMPHAYWGDAVTAFVHLRAGMNATEADLLAHCNAALARWKVPKAVHLRGPLPRNGMGKILRREVKREAVGDATGPS
jgi:acyl-CoA synthetase (AMP-forming)/AMP-acid ligase II